MYITPLLYHIFQLMDCGQRSGDHLYFFFGVSRAHTGSATNQKLFLIMACLSHFLPPLAVAWVTQNQYPPSPHYWHWLQHPLLWEPITSRVETHSKQLCNVYVMGSRALMFFGRDPAIAAPGASIQGRAELKGCYIDWSEKVNKQQIAMCAGNVR